MQNQDSNVQPTSESLPIGNANVGSSFSFAQLLETIHEKDHEAKYCVQYSDYEDNQWTIESLLLPHRIDVGDGICAECWSAN